MRPLRRIGALRTRLQLEAPVDTPDDTGAFVRTWAPVAALWGEVIAHSGDEAFTAGAIEVAISHLVAVRARDDIANGMRFVLGTRTLLIRSVTTADERQRFLLCRCEEFAP